VQEIVTETCVRACVCVCVCLCVAKFPPRLVYNDGKRNREHGAILRSE
jgi:hypothetical protein